MKIIKEEVIKFLDSNKQKIIILLQMSPSSWSVLSYYTYIKKPTFLDSKTEKFWNEIEYQCKDLSIAQATFLEEIMKPIGFITPEEEYNLILSEYQLEAKPQNFTMPMILPKKPKTFTALYTNTKMAKFNALIEISNKAISSMTCQVCGKKLIFRVGKFGDFWGCSGFKDKLCSAIYTANKLPNAYAQQNHEKFLNKVPKEEVKEEERKEEVINDLDELLY